MSTNKVQGPPYAPQTALIGGTPNLTLDIPITAIFLALYIIFAAFNMTTFQLNRLRNHKFLPSWALFGFCMARITTSIMRIAWAHRPENVRIAIAAQIFNNTGVLVVYLLNLLFAQRILRAMQPAIGWHKALSMAFKACYALVAAILVMVITAIVISYYTLDVPIKVACADCLKVASTLLFLIATSPLILLAVAFLLPRDRAAEETFGHGSLETKALILLLSTCLSVTLAGFKLGTAFEAPRSQEDPAWYHSKAAFYCFGFVLEIMILGTFALGQIDKRFHVPNGSSVVRTYQVAEVRSKEGRDSLESV